MWATAKGELGQGETFTLTIEAEVMPAALAGLNGEGNQITNTAYAFNNVTVPQSTQNEHGSSFTDGGWQCARRLRAGSLRRYLHGQRHGPER